MLKMFKMYCEDNEDVEFKFIHVFKRIEKCIKWAMVRASLGKGKDFAFDPTAALPAAEQGRRTWGTRRPIKHEKTCQQWNSYNQASRSASPVW
jgi:hypothetical protein